MRALIVGGTGTISSAVTHRLAAEGWDLWLLNRGLRKTPEGTLPAGVKSIQVDINDEAAVSAAVDAAMDGRCFDVAADFILFNRAQAERDYRLFRGKTGQYLFLSSASAYQKPASDYRINEGTPHANPFWEYSRNKIACEEFFMGKYRDEGFPVTVVLPSHTYDERSVPVGIHGREGSWQVIRRMLDGKMVLIHGDGASLWTMTHNSDFAAGFAGLLGNVHALGEMVQITSDETLTWNQIYGIIAGALGVPLRAARVSSEFLAAAGPYDYRGSLLGDKANSVVFDNAKLKRIVPGFTARVRFDEGVRRTLDYVRAHPECQREDPEFDAWCDRVIEAQERALTWMRGGGAGGFGDTAP